MIYNHNGYKRGICRCKCDCGNEILVKNSQINKTNTCGCYRRKDYTGKKFGKLLVTKMLYNHINNITYCECQCDCGRVNFITKMSGLVCGNTASCGCTSSPSLLNQKFGKLTVSEEVESNNNQRLWKCVCECGQVRFINSHTLKSGHTKSCGCLRRDKFSLMEKYITSILEINNIEYITEKAFEDCIGINGWKLRFDFFLPKYNTLIEYDGMQHFKPIEYFGGVESYNTLKSNDQIKNDYCKYNNIDLIRLPYTLSNNEIEEKILSSLKVFKNPVTTTVV